jgi:hypothetical protein
MKDYVCLAVDGFDIMFIIYQKHTFIRYMYIYFLIAEPSAMKSSPSSSSSSSFSTEGSNKADQNVNVSRNLYSSESRIDSARLINVLNGPRSVFGSLGEVFQTSSYGTMSENLGIVTPCHLPLQRVGSSPGMGMPYGSLEDRLREFHTRSPSTLSSNGTESISRSNLLLPGRFSASNKPKTKSIEILGELSQKDDLEMQTVDFRQQPATFQNEFGVQKLQHDGLTITRERKLNDVDELHNRASRHKTVPIEKHSTSNDLSRACLYDSESSVEVTQDGDSLKGPLRTHRCHECHQESTDVCRQVTSMEKQLESQQKHIEVLQKRVEEISR